MIQYKTGDVLTEDAEALVNTVNCVGIMGRGIALQFKKAFPENFKAYAAACKRNEVQPGRMFVFETGHVTNPRYIINFPTKRHWRGKSRMEDIDAGLHALVAEVRSRNIRSIVLPPLGCGLGGLEWPDVRRRINAALQEFRDLKAVVFEPGGGPTDDRINRSTAPPKMTPGRAALIGLMDRYIRILLDPFVTLLEVHKLLYFMQVAGERLRLRYQKAPYGPYAENLRHALRAVEGHFITGCAGSGDAPHEPLDLLPGAVTDAHNFLVAHPETRARFDRVVDLIEGFESSFGLELLATVHWVVVHEDPASAHDVVKRTHAWDDRKKRFTPRQIHIALDVLARKDWTSDWTG